MDIGRWAEMVHPEDREETVSALQASERACGRFDLTYRFRHRNGEYILIEEHGLFLPDAQGVAQPHCWAR